MCAVCAHLKIIMQLFTLQRVEAQLATAMTLLPGTFPNAPANLNHPDMTNPNQWW